MKISYIIPYVPNQIRVRPYNFIKYIAGRGHKITLYTLWSTDAERQDLTDISQYCEKVVSCYLSKTQSAINVFLSLPTKQPLQSVYCWHPKFYEKILDDLKVNTPDVIHIEHLRGSCYGFRLLEDLKQIGNQIPIIWDSVDSITYLFSQAIERKQTVFQRAVLGIELPRTRKYEHNTLRSYKQILVTSKNDRRALLSLCNGFTDCANVQVIPNGVDLDYFHPGQTHQRAENCLIVSGKMSYHANINMVEFLVTQIMPKVWREIPDIELWVVGKDPPKALRDYANHKQITVTGTVSDLRPYLRNATLALAPIRYGAGIQNKVLEAMACETPVIATSQAISALQVDPGAHLFAADEPVEFASRVIELMNDPGKRLEMGRAGRLYVENWHDWKKIAFELEMVYISSSNNNPI
jgi:glycosyltransferase involved in cell wall biosynthesis